MEDRPKIKADNTRNLQLASSYNAALMPLAILLIGSLVIFLVIKFISVERTHHQLLDELESKSFGNKWASAYELSKYIASSKIDQKDIPLLAQKLENIYKQGVDAKTRNFIIVALGPLKSKPSIKLFELALDDSDSKVAFNAMVALGNMSKGTPLNLEKIKEKIMDSRDIGFIHAGLLAISNQNDPKGQIFLEKFLNHSDINLQRAAALALVPYKSQRAISVLTQILQLEIDESSTKDSGNVLNPIKLTALKLNILENIEKYQWKDLNPELLRLQREGATKIGIKAREVLNKLKN